MSERKRINSLLGAKSKEQLYILSPIMDADEQQSKPTNEIVKLILNSKSSLITNPNPIQVEIQMPVHLQKVYMYEAETQTLSNNEISDLLSKEAGDEARLT